MKTRSIVMLTVYWPLQAVLLGTALVLVLSTPLREHSLVLIPGALGLSMLAAAPLAWMLAPRLLSRAEVRRPIPLRVVAGGRGPRR